MPNKISVCMATYNGEKFIQVQMDSILKQLGPNDEVVVSDNGSKDKTLQILENYNDSRIKILNFSARKGPIWNFENALKHASGDFIFLSDQDDIWESDKLARALPELQKNILTVCNCYIVDGDGNRKQQETFFEMKHSGSGFVKNLISNTFLGCCLGFKKELLPKILPFPENIPMHDWWIGLCAEFSGPIHFIEVPGISYRRHGDNASSAAEKSKTTLFQKILFRFFLLKALLSKNA